MNALIILKLKSNVRSRLSKVTLTYVCQSREGHLARELFIYLKNL